MSTDNLNKAHKAKLQIDNALASLAEIRYAVGLLGMSSAYNQLSDAIREIADANIDFMTAVNGMVNDSFRTSEQASANMINAVIAAANISKFDKRFTGVDEEIEE